MSDTYTSELWCLMLLVSEISILIEYIVYIKKQFSIKKHKIILKFTQGNNFFHAMFHEIFQTIFNRILMLIPNLKLVFVFLL